MKAHTIVVLNDGDTWCLVDGCSVVVISDAEYTALCNGDIDPRDLQPIVELLIKDFTPKTDN